MLYRPVMGYAHVYRPVRRVLGQEQGPSIPFGSDIQKLVDSAKGAIESRIREEAKPMIIRAAVLAGLAGLIGGILLGPTIRGWMKKF
jgi:hypothetical protein